MRNILASMVVASAALTSSAWAFKAGDSLTPDALGKAEAIQGEAPKAWEPGKVYVLECWATWCGPCIAAIPHVDELYDKYKDKGLRVIGVNVWEDGKDKVAEFVKKKGDGMSYPVIYTGKEGSAFETDWLKPGGVNGIPHAFVVKDGKFLFSTHPSQLDDEMIEALIAGGEKQDAIVKGLADKEAKQGQFRTLMMDFQKASRTGDAEAMTAKLAEIEKLDPKAPYLPMMRTDLQLAKKDWAGFEKSLQELPEGKQGAPIVFQTAVKLDENSDVPESTRKAILAKLTKLAESEDGIPHVVVSRYQWLTGDKDGAKASAKKAIEKPGKLPAEVFTAYAASLDEGKPQTVKEVFTALNKAMQAKQGADE